MHVSVSVGNGGWVRWDFAEDDHAGSGLLRFVDERGRLRPAEMHLDWVPSQRTLGRLPVSSLEAWANDPADELGRNIRSRLDVPGPLLTVAASYYATTFGDQAPATWVRDMLWSQISDPAAPPSVKPTRALKGRPMPSDPVDAKLVPPSTKPYPLEFFEDVANVYSALALRYRDPNAQIADRNETPRSTVERWVKRCRELDLLPPAQQGKRG